MKKIFIVLLTVCTFFFCGCYSNLQDKTLPFIVSNESSDNSVSMNSEEKNISLLTDMVTIDRNPFFFEDDVAIADYNARFTFTGLDLPNEVELLITEVLSYENGIMYELKINYSEDFRGRNYYGWDRFHLGYFYVQKDKIYLIQDQNVFDSIKTEEDIINSGIIVCQEEEMKDALNENEGGWHEYILVNGNQREYYGYNSLSETGFYEMFIWEQGKGLIEYKCGFGAEKDDIELSLISD